jgi:uncharacterized protein (TIGR00730 family)
VRQEKLDPSLASLVEELIDRAGAEANRDLLYDVVQAALGLAGSGADRLDLKIARATLQEMAEAFKVFSPYRSVPKVTIFGSARTCPDDPLYAQARTLAARLASSGWMVVTGAGPGIMQASVEGAGAEHAFGVNIRLPAEQQANPLLAQDPKLVEMKYFFTRKLMLMKESAGFAVLPGGFGTQDEAFELLTLLQTGKAEPAPIVLLDTPGDTYWRSWEQFVQDELLAKGLISPDDPFLYRITDNVDEAVEEILGFYANYHSRRYVGELLVLRLKKAPSRRRLAELSKQFADICGGQPIHRCPPLPPERAERDALELERVALYFDRLHHGRLRQLIDELNREAL